MNRVNRIILDLFLIKVSIPTIIWIVLIDSKRLNCHLKMSSRRLSGSLCSDSEYTHAARVWDAFRCKTIADYYDIHLQWDVLLLADFFEKFHKTCLEFYSLDPLHYYTTPGLAWDAALTAHSK